MSYCYSEYRDFVFTDEGQRDFLKVRDKAHELGKVAGAITCESLIRGLSGSSWNMLACVDRLVEIHELLEVPNPHSRAGQHRIFILPYKG